MVMMVGNGVDGGTGMRWGGVNRGFLCRYLLPWHRSSAPPMIKRKERRRKKKERKKKQKKKDARLSRFCSNG